MEVSWPGELDFPMSIVTVAAGGERSGCLEPVDVGAGEPSQLSFHRAKRLEPGHEA